MSSPRRVSITGVKGWLVANQRNPGGIVPVGTNALLMKGSMTRISAREFAPAGVLARRPKAVASQLRARVSRLNSPSAAIQSPALAVERKPSARATATTSTPLSTVRMRLPRTWPVSTEVRVMPMVRKREMMPSLMSEQMLRAVVSAPALAI